MKILITGATGFVGSHLVDRLLRDKHEVICLYRNKLKLQEFKIGGTPLEGDLLDFKWINQLPVDLNAVIHTAGTVHSANPYSFYQINTEATAKLIEKLKTKYPHLIFGLISSQAAGGPSVNGLILDESSKDSPVSHYGKSKLLAEKNLKELAPELWKTFIIRPPMVIGPRDSAILDIFKIVKTGIIPVVGSPDEKKYSFVCVYDLIKGITQALYSVDEISGNTFYIAHPLTINYRTLITLIKKSMVKSTKPFVWFLRIHPFIIKMIASFFNIIKSIIPSFDPRLTPDKVQEIIPDRWVVSSEKSIKLLNLSYDYGIEETVKITYNDYKGRSWL